MLRYGSGAAAEQASPTGAYTRPTPKFLTAQVSRTPAAAGAASQVAKTRPVTDAAPAEQVGPPSKATPPGGAPLHP